MSKPISLEITDILNIDDLKVFAASESKLLRVLRSVKDDTDCVGLKWNEKKRAVAHVKRGCLIKGAEDLKIDNAKATSSLEEGGSYKFLGVLLENVKQEDRTVFFNMQQSCTCKGYLLAGLARCETTTELLRRTSILLITSSNVFHVDPDLATCRLTAAG